MSTVMTSPKAPWTTPPDSPRCSPSRARWRRRLRVYRRGSRVMFFSVEEWALTGSAQYVEALGAAERDKIALNVNLDSVAGSPNLAALSSGYARVEPFLLQVAA